MGNYCFDHNFLKEMEKMSQRPWQWGEEDGIWPFLKEKEHTSVGRKDRAETGEEGWRGKKQVGRDRQTSPQDSKGFLSTGNLPPMGAAARKSHRA